MHVLSKIFYNEICINFDYYLCCLTSQTIIIVFLIFKVLVSHVRHLFVAVPFFTLGKKCHICKLKWWLTQNSNFENERWKSLGMSYSTDVQSIFACVKSSPISYQTGSFLRNFAYCSSVVMCFKQKPFKQS